MRNDDYISYFEQNIEINKLDTISNELYRKRIKLKRWKKLIYKLYNCIQYLFRMVILFKEINTKLAYKRYKCKKTTSPYWTELEFFRDERHTQSPMPGVVYCLVHGKIFDQEHAHVCARTNRQHDRITCNYREYGSYTLYTYLLLSLCYSQDAETTMLSIARTTRVWRELIIRIHRFSHEYYSYARFIACLWKKNIFRITRSDGHTQTHKY